MAFDVTDFLAEGTRQCLALAKRPLPDLLAEAEEIRQRGHGRIVSYSRKVFIPLTHLCRDSCAYCTFAKPPRAVPAPYMSLEEVLAVAASGAEPGCKELLFTLGDKPELRYAEAADWLGRGPSRHVRLSARRRCRGRQGTRLLPHMNAGIMGPAEMAAMRDVSVSQGLMLEIDLERLCEKGGPHYGSPDKASGRAARHDRGGGRTRHPVYHRYSHRHRRDAARAIDSLLAMLELHPRHGHIQEIIIQNFRAKHDTRMADASRTGVDDLLWTAAAARLIFGPEMNIQAPPNLSYEDFPGCCRPGSMTGAASRR